MTSIYEQHDKAFNKVSAFVVIKGGERVATIAFKFPKDGAGRLWCYIHWIGLEMVRGYAGGYGYDKRSAAVEDAVIKIKGGECSKKIELEASNFVGCLKDIGGSDFQTRLREFGFQVVQAV